MKVWPDGSTTATARSSMAVGTLALALYLALSCIRLSAQGMYYDEVIMACPSFAYVGKEPLFSDLKIRGVPVLHLFYVGAIKSGIYGLYMRIFGQPFSILSWRLLGILTTGLGIFLFFAIAGPRLKLASLLIVAILLLSDQSVILMTRHDWGPVTLAMFLRMLLIAIWIRSESIGGVSTASSFCLGAVLGFAVFEKLSSIALVVPVLLFLCLAAARVGALRWLSLVAGGLIGSSPLLLANLVSYLRSGVFISLSEVVADKEHPVVFVPLFLSHYFGLANCVSLEMWLLGIEGLGAFLFGTLLMAVEIVLLLGVLLLCAIACGEGWTGNRSLRMAGILILSYFGIAAFLLLLPRHSWVHHWILGTPFHYVALALALPEIWKDPRQDPRRKQLRAAAVAGFALLVVLRISSVFSLTTALGEGRSSINWDPSLTRFAQFAVERADQAVFIETDWGILAQIYCLANGRAGLVWEPWRNYRGIADLEAVLEKSRGKAVYLSYKYPEALKVAGLPQRMIADMDSLPGCDEVPVDEEIRSLPAVVSRKFLCSSDGTRTGPEVR